MYLKPLGLSVGALALCSTSALAQMAMPTDAAQTCLADIAPWFGGTVTENGAVMPPSSVTFTDDNPNGGEGPQICNFYQWGAQTFLWLTSPEGDGRVLDGEAIFNVLPANEDGVRYFQNAASVDALNVVLRSEKGDVIGEVTQAGFSGGTLMSQGNSLVYYGVHTNDVYADFLTLQKNTVLGSDITDFPANADALMAVLDYVDGNSLPFPQAPETLVMELKTSWVEASTVSPISDYITIPAIVPTYTANADNTVWTPAGETRTTLALVGMHVVATVQDHPEFVWATFEHLSNAPDVGYWYNNGGTDPVEFPYDASGTFNFLASNTAAAGTNVECMTTKKDDDGVEQIVAETLKGGGVVCEGGIVPSNTTRTRPWGSQPYAPSDVTNGTVTQDVFDKVVTNNTELLSINTDVLGQLAAGDPRKNYVQTGGIWTTTPASGGDAPIPNQGGDQTAQMRGSLGLYNATMETYSQADAVNCFICHSLPTDATNSFGAFELSHIYSQIEKLKVD
ncbi:hypothetical protein [uncultured Tateyamaria sp.]|uniref:hypothetical protein n=1 Tax=uncultured Tateyamaria sp. TaxID=455651 RepID=UPI002620DD23|nr:hypothetical protein [uncultured Tateyamaria sp.]